MGKRDMKNKTPPSGAKSQSLVLRLNTRLFFRQLGIFQCMDLLLVVLALMGQLTWPSWSRSGGCPPRRPSPGWLPATTPSSHWTGSPREWT